MKMTTCSMFVNLEQMNGTGTGEGPPLPHPGRSVDATSAAAVAAPILNNSRRVTFLEGMGSFIPLLSLRQIGDADPATRQLPHVRPVL